MQEATTRPDSPSYLSGSTIPPWHAVGLRNLSSAEQIARFLKTGVDDHAAAYGPMTEVVSGSTQYFADADLSAVAQFLTSLSTRKGASTVASSPGSVPETLYTTRGGLGYAQFCSSCHQRDGRGAPGVVPPLAGNGSVMSEDPTSVIHVVLTGWTEAATQHSKHAFSMPDYGRLTDAELAEILTFVRTSWGNAGAAITASQIKDQREALKLAPSAPSKFTVWRFADMLAAPDADQLVRGMRLMTETKALLPDNVGDVMNCSSCHLNGGTAAKGAPFNGVAALFPMDNRRAGRIISIEERLNGCFLRSMNGKPIPVDSQDMKAMVAFMSRMKADATPEGKIVGRGTGQVDPKLIPDPVRGKSLFEANCAVCHGLSGRGMQSAGRRLAVPAALGRRIRSTSAQGSRGHSRQRPSSRRTCRSLIRRHSRRDRAGSRTRTPSTSRIISPINRGLTFPTRSRIGQKGESRRTRDTEAWGRPVRRVQQGRVVESIEALHDDD